MQNKYKITNKQKNDRPASNLNCFLSSKNSGNSKNYSSYEYCILGKSKMEQNFPDNVFHIYLARFFPFSSFTGNNHKLNREFWIKKPMPRGFSFFFRNIEIWHF